jgi:hypothetical protein
MSALQFLQTITMRRTRVTGGKRRAAHAPNAAGRSVGRYRLLEPIGKGAVGDVWRAEDPRIGRAVAIKLLNIPPGSGRQRSEWEERFVREARAAGALSHPNIVTIHDVGVGEEGQPYIVMELVEGSSLDAILQKGPVDERTVLVWGAQIAEALDAAHRQGIVHRDIKPANVLVDADGRARIADFGIARLSESDLTHEGLFLGSPAFASPEQIRGAGVDGRSDLFSLGAVLYALLAGDRPFRGEDLSSLAFAILQVEPAPLVRRGRGVSPAAEAVIMKALSKNPGGRYRSARDMAEDLRAAAFGRETKHAAVPRRLEDTVREEAPGKPALPAAVPAPAPSGRRAGGIAPTVAMALAVLMAVGAAVGIGHLVSGPAGGSPAVPARLAAVIGPAQRAPIPAAVPLASGSQEWAPPGSSARVTLRIIHELPDGVLSVWSGRRRLLQTTLEAAGPAGSAGTGEWGLRLPSGEHALRVRVTSREKAIDLQQDFTRVVREGQDARLQVRVRMRPVPKLEIQWTGA